MKKKLGIMLLFLAVLFVVGCSKGSDQDGSDAIVDTETVEEETEAETEPTDETKEIPEDHVKSRLSGLYVAEEVATHRPYAIMFNNLKAANPQSGISEAPILYEALVEGGITRLMGVLEELHPDRIGSIRSGRQYFASIADEYDSVFVSVGESASCTKKIVELGLDQLSGLKGEGGTVFYRDSSIKAPHNAFTSNDRIEKGMEIKNLNPSYNENMNNHFIFNRDDTELVSDQTVHKLTLNFSTYTSPYFTYNEENKVYMRFQHGGEHIDANTGQQLEFKNVIVQFVDGFAIDELNSFSFRQGSGQGYYISNGRAVPITWDKNEGNRSMVYYDLEGNMLSINPGKTFIAIFPGNNVSGVSFE